MSSESGAIKRIVGGGFTFAMWFLLITLYFKQASYIPFGILGIAGMVAIVVGRTYVKGGATFQAIAKALLYTTAGILFAVIGANSWFLYAYDPLNIFLFLLSDGVAIGAAFIFIEGIERLVQITRQS